MYPEGFKRNNRVNRPRLLELSVKNFFSRS